MALSTKYRSNPYVLRDTNQMLTIQRKAFANNNAITVNGVVELSRYVASVSAYITSDRLVLEDMSLASINKNATINVLEENGWNHRCCTSRNLTPANAFTEGKGIPTTKIISNVQSLGSSSIASPKTIAQLMTQMSTLTNTLPARDYTGHIALTNAPKTMNAQSGKKIMGDNAFASCARLASVRMSSDNSWNAFYSNGCFKSCSSLTTISTMTNSNSGMSQNVAVSLPAGTISAIIGSTTVNGISTQFATTIASGQMLFTGAASREDAKYIGTVKSVQSNTQFTLTLPSVLSYSGTFRIATEAMIAAHITTIGQEALRGTNIRVASIESHLNPTVAASNSKLAVIGSNAFMDCPFLSSLHFSVKQSSGLTRLGTSTDSVIPVTANLSIVSSDGWTTTANQTQLAALINVSMSRVVSIPKFTYSARLDPTVLDSNNQPMRIVTITGFAVHDVPISHRNLVIPNLITHSDEKTYQVYDIRYPYIDQIETIVGQPNRIYGAFNKSNPAFSIGETGNLSGTLTLPNTLRYIDNYAFESQSALSGNLTIACPGLSYIGSKCFFNSFGGGKTLTILNSPKITLNIGSQCYANASFNPIVIRSMTNSELITYAF